MLSHNFWKSIFGNRYSESAGVIWECYTSRGTFLSGYTSLSSDLAITPNKGVDKGGGGGGGGGGYFLRFPSLIINHQFSIHEFYLEFPNINIRLWLQDTTHLLFCSSQDHLFCPCAHAESCTS